MVRTIKKYLCFSGLVLFIGAAVVGPADALPENRVISATHKLSETTETIMITTRGNPDYHIFRLNSPERLVFTIKDSFFPKIHENRTVHGEAVSRIRISQNTRSHTRLVLDLTADKPYQTTKSESAHGLHQFRISFPRPPLTQPDRETGGLKPILLTRSIVTGTISASRPPESESNEKKIQNDVPMISPHSGKPDAPPRQLETNASEGQVFTALNQSGFDESVFDETGADNRDTDDFTLSGSLQLRGAADTNHDQPNENRTGLKNRSIVELAYKKNIVFSGLSDYLYFGSKNEINSYDIDLFEAYVKHHTDRVTITVGKQIRRWGKTDQISPVDTLNPENITEFIMPTYEERKIPVWMADIIFRKDPFFLESVFIPFFEPARFKYFGTDWAIFGHLKDDINDTGLTPFQKAYFSSINVRETEPDKNSDSFEYAFRVGGTIRQIDFSLMYHYANEDMPYFESFPVKNLSINGPGSIGDMVSNLGSFNLTNEPVKAKYLRTQIFSVEFETILSRFGIRGEAAFQENESLLTKSFTSVRKPVFSWVIGADYRSANDWYVNLQFGHRHIGDYHPDILFYDQDNYSLIGEVSKTIFSDWLEGSVRWTQMLNDGSLYLSPRLTYTYIKNLKLMLGFNLFQGSDTSIFGQYDRNDQAFIELTYYF